MDGKRLNDAKLEGIIARNNIEKNYRAAINERIYGADADVAKLLSHIAAITANRGSVSEERVDVRGIAFAAMEEMRVKGESYPMCARWISERVHSAIQQAVSECSGGGAEEWKDAARDYHWKLLAHLGHLRTATNISASDAMWLMMRAAEHALPLPPSPVKLDHRADCQLYTVPTYGLCTCDFDQRKAAEALKFTPRPEPEAFGVQPRSHRMSEGEK